MTDAPMLEPTEAYALWAPYYPAHAHNPLMQAEERAMLTLIPGELAGHSVLDAGCGSGRYLLHALRRGATRVTGVDLSPAMLDRARAELGACQQDGKVEVELLQGSLEALPLPDAWSTLTICGLVIGHLGSLEQALAELRRVTRPGGRVLCSDVHPIGMRSAGSAISRRAASAMRYATRRICSAIGTRPARPWGCGSSAYWSPCSIRPTFPLVRISTARRLKFPSPWCSS